MSVCRGCKRCVLYFSGTGQNTIFCNLDEPIYVSSRSKVLTTLLQDTSNLLFYTQNDKGDSPTVKHLLQQDISVCFKGSDSAGLQALFKIILLLALTPSLVQDSLNFGIQLSLKIIQD